MRYALGIPGQRVRIFLDTCRIADVAANKLPAEVALPIGIKAGTDNKAISADGKAIISTEEASGGEAGGPA